MQTRLRRRSKKNTEKRKMKKSILNDAIVFLPTYKEPEGVKLVINELREVFDPFILVVNRKTGDSTGDNAEKLGAIVLTQRSKGKGSAINEALTYLEAISLNHKYVIMIDADNTYPTRYIPEMIEILESKPDVGMVCGQRPPTRDLDIFHFGNQLLTYAHRIFNGVKIMDPCTGLRVIRFELIKNWSPKSKGFDIEVELNHFIQKIQRTKIVEIPIEYRERVGEKKLSVKHGVTIMKRIVWMALN